MYNLLAYAAIDAVQDLKIKCVEHAVQHTGTKDALKSFVEAQRKYTKSAVDSGLVAMTSLAVIYSNPELYKEAAEQWLKMVKVK
jgi:hypothetical protein